MNIYLRRVEVKKVKGMKYIPKYSEDKLNQLKEYVKKYKAKFLKKAASIVTEEMSTKVTKKPNDGDARYKYFNNLLFEGELPDYVKVYFLNSKEDKSKSSGFDTPKRRANYLDIKSAHEGTYGCWYPDSQSIYIFLDRLENNDFVIDSILVHEMCHVWQDEICQKKSTSAHSYPFQYIKRKVQKNSKNIYDVGAYSDAEKKSEKYNNGWYGDPSIGKSPKEVETYYKDRINEFTKENKHSMWKIFDLKKKLFRLSNQSSIVIKFTSQGFKGETPMTSTLAKNLNKDKDFIEGLKERFEQIKKHRGF